MIGETISHYRIIERLGEGGMGVVYKAEDTRLKRIVALKFLPRELTEDPDARRRFTLEAEAASALQHGNICVIHDIDSTPDGQLFICMEYLDGETLKAKISRGVLPVGQAVGIAVRIARGLNAAHEHGVVHRDIKPANIMVSSNGEVKIVDFGLAKLAGGAIRTRTGSTLGTAAYMSPEQAQGMPADARTDVWSLGVLLYEMLTGGLPFRGEHDPARLYSIVHDPPRPMETSGTDIPPKLVATVEKCLQKDREQRYPDAGALLQELEAAGTGESGGIPGAATRSIRMAAVFTAAVVLLLAGIYAITSLMQPAGASEKTVAVLPFANFSGNPEEDFFSAGMTDDILTELHKIGNLKVISRTTMRRYADTRKSMRQIGEELRADAILEGSVRRVGNRLRIVVQLISASGDEHLWAETYDRELGDVLAVQSEIALNIAGALHTTLTESDRNRLEARPAINAEVYTLLLQGGHIMARGSRDDIPAAISKFKAALAIDSTSARAWARLATAYARQADMGAVRTEEGYEKARDAATRALALDPRLAEAHTVRGWIRRSYDWDWAGAEEDCRNALALAPGDVSAIRNMANMDKSMGRFEEAAERMRRAAELDPLWAPVFTSLGLVSMYAGRLEQAGAAYRRAIELYPNYTATNTFLSLVYLLQGRPDSAVAVVLRESDDGWRLYGMAQVFHGTGQEHTADSALQELIADFGSESAYQVAQAYAYRGERDSAFEWLERAYAARDGGLSEIKGDPFLKKIESDPRYADLLKRLRLPS